MENLENAYTRKRFFELLSIHYPDDAYQDDDGYIDFKYTDKKKVAEDLNMGSSQISGFFNPFGKNSYKNIIKNLERFLEVKQLRRTTEVQQEKLTQFEQELLQQEQTLTRSVQSLNQLEGDASKYKASRRIERIVTYLVFGLSFLILWNHQRLNNHLESKVQVTSSPERVTIYESSYQPNRQQLDTLLDWHFHHLNYWVATEILAFYADWKSGTVYAKENFDHEWKELQGRVKGIIFESRDNFRGLNIKGPSGENLIEFIKGSYDVDQALSRSFKEYKPSIQETALSNDAMIHRIVEKSREIQNIGLVNILAKWDSSERAQIEKERLIPTQLTQPCLVRNKPELDVVMRWHGENIINRLIWQAILENEKVKLGQTELENGLINTESLNQLGDTIFDIIESGRTKLGNIGFETTTGYRIDSLVAKAFTRDRMKKILGSKGVEVLSDKTKTYREIKDAIELMVIREQEEAWKAMAKKAFGEGG